MNHRRHKGLAIREVIMNHRVYNRNPIKSKIKKKIKREKKKKMSKPILKILPLIFFSPLLVWNAPYRFGI